MLSTYEWEGEPHNSVSIKKVNGLEVARNYTINSDFQNGGSDWVTYGAGNVTYGDSTAVLTGANDSIYQTSKTRIPDITEDTKYTLTVLVRGQGTLQVRWGASSGYNVIADTPIDSDEFVEIFGTSDEIGNINLIFYQVEEDGHLEIDKVMLTVGTTRHKYFDGDSPPEFKKTSRSSGWKITHEWEDIPHRSASFKKINGLEIARNLVDNPTMDPSGPRVGRANNSASVHSPPYSAKLPVMSPNGSLNGMVVDIRESNIRGALVSVYDADNLGSRPDLNRWLSLYVYATVPIWTYVSTTSAPNKEYEIPAYTWAYIHSGELGSGFGGFTAYRNDYQENTQEDKVYWTDMVSSTHPISFLSGDVQDYQIPYSKIFYDGRWVPLT